MKLAELVKTKASRVLGIDASTNSFAFCLMENDKPLKWGKIEFAGADIYEKIYDAKLKMHAMLDELKSHYYLALPLCFDDQYLLVRPYETSQRFF